MHAGMPMTSKGRAGIAFIDENGGGPGVPTAKAAPEEELDRRNGYGAAVCGI